MPNRSKKIGQIIEENLEPLMHDILLTLKARQLYNTLSKPYPTWDSRVSAVRNKTVTVRADNAAAAAKLGYMKNNLLQLFQKNGIMVDDLKILSHPLALPTKQK